MIFAFLVLALLGVAAVVRWAVRRAWVVARNRVLLHRAAQGHTWDLLLAQINHHQTGGQR